MLDKNLLSTVVVLSVRLFYAVSAQEYGPGLSDYVLVNDYEPSNFFDQFNFIVVSFVIGCTTVLAAKTNTDQVSAEQRFSSFAWFRPVSQCYPQFVISTNMAQICGPSDSRESRTYLK
jgi:hypothetical protein